MDYMRIGRYFLWGLVALLLVAVCLRGYQMLNRPDPELIMSYEVPPEILAEVQSALATVLSRGEGQRPLGRVSVLSNGRMMVTAPGTVQAGVARILDDITRSKPEATPSIAFDLWTVVATPGASSSDPAALAEIAPALASIREANGARRFALREKLSLVTRSGLKAVKVMGNSTEMQVQASLRRSEQDQRLVAADVDVTLLGFERFLRLQAVTEMVPGELMVLGQSATGTVPGRPSDPDTQIYYILRARL